MLLTNHCRQLNGKKTDTPVGLSVEARVFSIKATFDSLYEMQIDMYIRPDDVTVTASGLLFSVFTICSSPCDERSELDKNHGSVHL